MRTKKSDAHKTQVEQRKLRARKVIHSLNLSVLYPNAINAKTLIAGMSFIADYARFLVDKAFGIPVLTVLFINEDADWRIKCHEEFAILFNVRSLGPKWFDRPDTEEVDEQFIEHYAHLDTKHLDSDANERALSFFRSCVSDVAIKHHEQIQALRRGYLRRREHDG